MGKGDLKREGGTHFSECVPPFYLFYEIFVPASFKFLIEEPK